jgi:hypothetical protein
MRTSLVLILSLLTPTAAYAQETPAMDVAAGYAFLRDQDLEDNFHGWLAAVAGNVTPTIGIVGEVGGNYTTVQVLGTDISFSVHSFLGGPRFSIRQNPGVTPFFHFLAGAVRGSASVVGQSESSTEFAIQPGGGVDFWLRPNVGLRAGADYRRILEDAGTNEFRIQVGLVFSGGTR